MATESRTIGSDLAATVVGEKLCKEPYSFDFFQAVRLLERLMPEQNSVGQFVHPNTEVARFGAHPSLAFPASQIQEMTSPENAPVRMVVNFMGLTGPEGVLPNPYTSLIIERMRSSDYSLRDFLDIFNHRIISLFYRAWRKYRFDVAAEQSERELFSRHLLSLIGLGTDGLRDRQAVPDDTLIYYSGLLAQRPRSAQALKQILADYFDVPVAIEQFAGDWYRLDPETQCCFSDRNNGSEALGLGAVVGDEVWNQQSKVRIVLGPLSLERYADFLPDGKSWEPLQSWVRFFSNDEWEFEVKLVLAREHVPACTLGAEGTSGPQLGWVSWVKSVSMQRDPGDTVLALDMNSDSGQVRHSQQNLASASP
ncbi:MAG TPA: type VI secretion system baseplate subunit TssG [Candidatus Sulfotelmatobacter sp.]|nr:type VI secretion system baseplate subunit TssG [Candidatus Sulfotelmatobacter sp.]